MIAVVVLLLLQDSRARVEHALGYTMMLLSDMVVVVFVVLWVLLPFTWTHGPNLLIIVRCHKIGFNMSGLVSCYTHVHEPQTGHVSHTAAIVDRFSGDDRFWQTRLVHALNRYQGTVQGYP